MVSIAERRRRRYAALHGVQGISVGALERRDPIPPGVYWIDSIDADAYDDPDMVQAAREGYLLAIDTAHPGAYRVVRDVHHDSQLIGNAPARDWILFEVKAPIPRWPVATQWGIPTIAPNGLNTQEGDTVQKPPPEPGLFDEGGGLPWYVWAGGGALVVLGLAYVLK